MVEINVLAVDIEINWKLDTFKKAMHLLQRKCQDRGINKRRYDIVIQKNEKYKRNKFQLSEHPADRDIKNQYC